MTDMARYDAVCNVWDALSPVSTKLTLTKGPASVSALWACMPMCTSCPVVSAWNTWDWLGTRMRVKGSPAPQYPPPQHAPDMSCSMS